MTVRSLASAASRGFGRGAARLATWCGAPVLLLLATAAAAAPATRLTIAGWPLGAREAETLLGPALRAPSDSGALARSLRDATARLQSGGWLDASLAAAWDTAGRVLALEVASGTRYRWGRLAITVPREDSAALARGLVLPTGEPVDPALLAQLVDRELRLAEDRGHAWAQLALTGWEQDSGRVNVRLAGTLGPRVQVSGVRIDGLHVTRADVAERALGRLAGRTYDPASARAAALRLSQLEVFSRAEFTGLEGGPQWQAGTLAYRVEEPRYNRFEGAVGFQGATGMVGLAAVELGNLLGTARSAALGWQSRGAGRTDFRVRYTEPYLAGLPFRLQLAMDQKLQDSSYSLTRMGARLSHVLGTGDRIEAGYDAERVIQPRGEVSEAVLQNTLFGYERDARDARVSPRRGTRFELSGAGVAKREELRAPLAGEPTVRRSHAGVAQAWFEAHRPFAPSSGASLELWATGRFSSERVLPDYERTPVGGARTLRGHDEEEFLVDRALVTRLEYRWFPGTMGERVALFWDHALMYTRLPLLDAAGVPIGDRSLTQNADGVGVGLRLRSAGGLVDVDYGLEPGKSFLDGKLHLRLVSTF